MAMSQALRKLVLTLHVITTMGWLGAICAYIPIAYYVLSNDDTASIRSAIQIMSLIVNFIVIPVAFASLISGVALSLGTKWGLVRHYWIFFKLLFTAIAVFMLVTYSQVLNQAASVAEHSILSSTDISQLKSPLHLLHPSGGMLVVLLVTVLSVYKPIGMTKYGWNKQKELKGSKDTSPHTAPPWVNRIGIVAVLFLWMIVILMVFADI